MSITWQCCVKRSTSADTHAAPGKTVPHALKASNFYRSTAFKPPYTAKVIANVSVR